ncbi:MAG: hypothetical protein GXY08_05905 [Ruminococcus sp.]|nr:hypothetical protein [Ruminococcus sp.]
MEERNEFAVNHATLKKCKKYYTIIFYYYIASSILLLIYSFTNLVCIGVDAGLIMKAGAKPLAPSYFILLLDALIFAPLTTYLGARISLKQHDLSTIMIALFLSLNLCLFLYKRNNQFFDRVPIAWWTFVLYNFNGIIAACIGFRTNMKYHWLEAQTGFPLFNERLEEQKVKIDKFQCEYNRLKRTSTDKMEELPVIKRNDNKL